MPGQSNPVFSMEEVAWTAYQYWGKGFGGDLVTAIATAIAWAESKGNTKAHNTTPPDNSYGLWQINMIGGLGPSRRVQFNLSTNEDLYSPTTNARVAYALSNNGTNFGAWSTFKSGAYKQYLDQAKSAVKNRKQPGNVTGGPDSTKHEGIDALLNPVFDFFKQAGLRVAGFVGGAGLIIGAVVLVSKRGVK